MAQPKTEKKRVDNEDIPGVSIDFDKLDEIFRKAGKKSYFVDVDVCDDDDADGGKKMRYRRKLDGNG
ncbi:MAG TPA: hypothetical protein VHP37_21195 [Burkholderiales bacterium]|nr:hypothetical protein [Burkholderiales bacterium]